MQVMCDVNRLTTDLLKMDHKEQYQNLPLRVHNIKLEDIQALTSTIIAQGRTQVVSIKQRPEPQQDTGNGSRAAERQDTARQKGKKGDSHSQKKKAKKKVEKEAKAAAQEMARQQQRQRDVDLLAKTGWPLRAPSGLDVTFDTCIPTTGTSILAASYQAHGAVLAYLQKTTVGKHPRP